jgi:tetratricopeptide (TPR) repeat protein
MAHVFDGRPQEGAAWFNKALAYQNRLPNMDATLLDIYADLWLRNKFDDAFVKMEMLVRNHPSDKETRYIYALMIDAFTADHDRAYAEMDTALQFNPQYLSALTGYATLFIKVEEYDSALVYAMRAKEFHPESPSGYLLLGQIYIRTDQFEKAAQTYKEMLREFPANKNALTNLNHVSVHMRKFDEAHEYLEKLRQYHGSDAYVMADYYAELANLDMWKGQFHSAMDNYFRTVEAYLTTGDSTLVSSTYATISNQYQRFGMSDSAIYYSYQSYLWGNLFNRLDYPITMAAVSAPVDDSILYLFKDLIADAAARLPEGMVPLAEGVRMIFRGHNTGDTSLVIEGLKTVINNSSGGQPSNERRIGALSVMIGRYQEGIDYMEKYVESRNMTRTGYDYLSTRYYLGVAEQELGHNTKAAEHFREMLRYWGDPEIELKEIKDARQRLARLTS